MDDNYNIYKTLKKRNYKYLVRIYWMPSELKYRNTKFMYKWYLTKKQQVGVVIMEFKRFLTEECLNGQEWWNCILNTYL